MIEYAFKPLEQWPRKSTATRCSPFRASLSRTYQDLERELRHLQVVGPPVVIEVGLESRDIRNDGRPRTDARRPRHPGVILSFRSRKHGSLRFLCDDCFNWEDNLRAIALTMEHLRGADRYGVTKDGEQYRGWKALPGAIITPPAMTVKEAAEFIASTACVPSGSAAGILASASHFRLNYHVATKRWHPDMNDGQELPEWHQLQAAAKILRRHHGLRSEEM